MNAAGEMAGCTRPAARIAAGDRVRHQFWGDGVVIEVLGDLAIARVALGAVDPRGEVWITLPALKRLDPEYLA